MGSLCNYNLPSHLEEKGGHDAINLLQLP